MLTRSETNVSDSYRLFSFLFICVILVMCILGFTISVLGNKGGLFHSYEDDEYLEEISFGINPMREDEREIEPALDERSSQASDYGELINLELRNLRSYLLFLPQFLIIMILFVGLSPIFISFFFKGACIFRSFDNIVQLLHCYKQRKGSRTKYVLVSMYLMNIINLIHSFVSLVFLLMVWAVDSYDYVVFCCFYKYTVSCETCFCLRLLPL